MWKRIKCRVVASVLVMTMVLSLTSIQNVEAAGNETTTTMAETTEQLKLQYVYTESSYVSIPGEQKAVVSFENNVKLDGAVLVYLNKTTGERFEAQASEMLDSAATFTMSYTEETQSGEYLLKSVKVESDGETRELDFSSYGIECRYGVNQECETAPDAVVEDSASTASYTKSAAGTEVSFMTLSEDGELEKAGSAEEAIASVEGQVASKADARSVMSARTTEKKDVVIVLDPGHGGNDGGASGFGANEKDLTLKIAKYCRAELEEYCGVKVYMTREGDTYPSLSERVDYAKSVGADVLVSIHLNSTGKGTANGAEVYYPNGNYSSTIGNEGKTLAQNIQNELVSLGLKDRGIKIRNSANGSTYPDGSTQDYYAVIWQSKKAGFPGIIVEHAFIDNASDFNTYLNSDAKLQKLGHADAIGLVNYFGLVKGEWKQDENGWWFQYADGSYPANCWKYLAGAWYYFDAKGYRQTDFQEINGSTYYFDENGVMQVGWKQIEDIWYFFSESGAMCHGQWLLIGGTWYYLEDDGKMVVGWKEVGGSRYYFNKSGAMLTGWQEIDKNWYYFTASGAMAKNTWIGNYYVDQSGVWQKDKEKDPEWIQSGTRWWYKHGDGSYTTNNWELIAGKWYYFDAAGWMVTGWKVVGSSWYYFTPSGAMASDTWIGDYYVDASGAWNPNMWKNPEWILSGARWWYRHKDGSYTKNDWEMIAGTWYYFDTAGWMVTGWREINSKWYYFTSSGAMASDTWIGNYYVDKSGVWQQGKEKDPEWVLSGNRWWYKHGDGSYTKNDWETISGAKYYFDAEGWMVTGWREIDFKWYYFTDSGAMASDTWIGDYYVDASGVWNPNMRKNSEWILAGEHWWYRHADGSYTKNDWETIDGKKYYFDAEGWMITGWKKIENKWYFFSNQKAPVGALSYTGVMPIMGESELGATKEVVVSKLVRMFESKKGIYPADIYEIGGAADIQAFCEILYEEAIAEDVKPEVVFGQAMNETGYLKFGGDVKPEQYNFAGLGATGSGAGGASFESVRMGLRAQVQHLKAYGSDKPLNQNPDNPVDPRFKYVTRNCAPYVEWLGVNENPDRLGWATASEYGMNLVTNYIKPILSL